MWINYPLIVSSFWRFTKDSCKHKWENAVFPSRQMLLGDSFETLAKLHHQFFREGKEPCSVCLDSFAILIPSITAQWGWPGGGWQLVPSCPSTPGRTRAARGTRAAPAIGQLPGDGNGASISGLGRDGHAWWCPCSPETKLWKLWWWKKKQAMMMCTTLHKNGFCIHNVRAPESQTYGKTMTIRRLVLLGD